MHFIMTLPVAAQIPWSIFRAVGGGLEWRGYGVGLWSKELWDAGVGLRMGFGVR